MNFSLCKTTPCAGEVRDRQISFSIVVTLSTLRAFASRMLTNHSFFFSPSLAIMPIIMKSRILCCSRNRAAVHDFNHSQPLSQMKKPIPEKAESRTTLLEKEQEEHEPAFRGIPSLTSEDFDDLLSLKRANPVYESDDEEDFRFVKRQRRDERDDEEESAVPQEVVLHWSDLVVEDEELGYLLSFTSENVE
jgi:hypothetical protein